MGNEDDDDIIKRLYRYKPAVTTYFKRFGFNPDEASDLTQTVFVRVCQSVKTYRGEATLAYLERIAKNVALNAIRDRHAAKRAGIEVPDDAAVELSDPRNIAADKLLEQKEKSQRLRQAIEKLDGTSKPAVLLYLDDLSYGDIATTLGITVSAVKSRLHAARQDLKELLGEELQRWGGEDDR